MRTDMINRVQMPDQTSVPIHDWQRGQPNGVATLNANSKTVQEFNGFAYAQQLPAPSPYSSDYNLVEWAYLMLTEGL